jgi:hypothetical protein
LKKHEDKDNVVINLVDDDNSLNSNSQLFCGVSKQQQGFQFLFFKYNFIKLYNIIFNFILFYVVVEDLESKKVKNKKIYIK